MQKNNNKVSPPPNLLRGIIIAVIGVISCSLFATGFIINDRVEGLIEQRTSEYAHSIARIAADSSSEALLSEDILQLNLLVENVAKDPYIRQATIYSEEGVVVSQYPTEPDGLSNTEVKLQAQTEVDLELKNSSKSNKVESNSNTQVSEAFALRQKNIPFIEPITYRDITAGWFKLEIESHLLEQNFRSTFQAIQVLSGGIALLLFIIMLVVLFRLENGIKRVVESCQHLLLQNKINPPAKKGLWIDALSELASEHPQQLKEHLVMPAQNEQWVHSSITQGILVCVFEFNIKVEQFEDIAEQLTIAEKYLNQTVQAFGVQSQGDILTGCLVPFQLSGDSTVSSRASQIDDALCFIELVKKLMNNLPIALEVKSCLCRTSVLVLEDEHELVTGIRLLDDLTDKIKRVMLSVDYGQSVALLIKPSELENSAELESISIAGAENIELVRLTGINPNLAQQINRKFVYISSDQRE